MSPRYTRQVIPCIFSLAMFVAACGGGSSSEPAETSAVSADSDLSIEAQIGPITSVELGEIDPGLIEQGEASFKLRCTACHQMETRVVGPPLGNVLDERSPEYVMNMILNPTQMLAEHPAAKAMLEEYAVPMADLGVTEEEARGILEYLRSVAM